MARRLFLGFGVGVFHEFLLLNLGGDELMQGRTTATGQLEPMNSDWNLSYVAGTHMGCALTGNLNSVFSWGMYFATSTKRIGQLLPHKKWHTKNIAPQYHPKFLYQLKSSRRGRTSSPNLISLFWKPSKGFKTEYQKSQFERLTGFSEFSSLYV